jgi:hypothetical protein
MAKKKTQLEIKRSRIMAQRRKALRIRDFKPKETSICGRTAEFLIWAKDRYPHQFVSYEEITQAIFSLGKVPARTSAHVKSVRGQMSSAAKKLTAVYHTDIITEAGFGSRAAVDNTDRLKNVVPKAVDNYKRAATKLQETADRVNPANLEKELDIIPNGEEKQEVLELAEWFNERLVKLVRRIKQPQQIAALLPPAPTE